MPALGSGSYGAAGGAADVSGCGADFAESQIDAGVVEIAVAVALVAFHGSDGGSPLGLRLAGWLDGYCGRQGLVSLSAYGRLGTQLFDLLSLYSTPRVRTRLHARWDSPGDTSEAMPVRSESLSGGCHLGRLRFWNRRGWPSKRSSASLLIVTERMFCLDGIRIYVRLDSVKGDC